MAPLDFTGTTFAALMGAVDAVYSRIEGDQRDFALSARAQGAEVSCPPGCGECCTTFIPDVVPLEAQRLALHLLAERPDLLARLYDFDPFTGSGCPFHDPDSPGTNCSVYPARPLICRLFGFASVSGKRGDHEFSLCRRMTGIGPAAARRFIGAAIAGTFGAEPPVMADRAAELLALDPSGSGARESLPAAMPAAIAKVGLYIHYFNDDGADAA